MDNTGLGEADKLNLSNLLKDYDGENNTNKIKQLKHSKYIRADVVTIEKLKIKYENMRHKNYDMFKGICMKQAEFLYNNYTNIFHRLVRDTLKTEILFSFIETLKMIEDGKIDQHEASVSIGRLLKRLYIDQKVNEKEHKPKNKFLKPKNKISWEQFKQKSQLENIET